MSDIGKWAKCGELAAIWQQAWRIVFLASEGLPVKSFEHMLNLNPNLGEGLTDEQMLMASCSTMLSNYIIDKAHNPTMGLPDGVVDRLVGAFGAEKMDNILTTAAIMAHNHLCGKRKRRFMQRYAEIIHRGKAMFGLVGLAGRVPK